MADTIEAIKASGGPDMKALSTKAKLSAGYVSAVLKQGRTPSIDNFLKIAQACGVEPGWLLFGDEHFRVQFPVIGQAHDEEAWQPIDSDRIGRVAFELGSAAIDMVVIEVLGDGNAPAYRDRDMLFCARHAGRNLRNIVGRDCVVRTRGGEYLIKQALERQTPGTLTLRSVSNPVAKDLENVAIEWAAPIVWIRRSGR